MLKSEGPGSTLGAGSEMETTEAEFAPEFDWDVAADAVVVIDRGHRAVMANEAARAFRPGEKLIGANFFEWFHGRPEPPPGCRVIEAFENGRNTLNCPNRRQAGVGCYEILCYPLKGRGGKVEQAVHVVRDVSDRIKERREREELIARLEEAVASIKTLSGLIPICSECKKIRDDSGYWNQLEAYLRDHTEAEFSHGLCPECLKKLYPEFLE